MAILLGKPEIARCSLDNLRKGFGAVFFGLDALPDANQQNYEGLYLFGIHYDSSVGSSLTPLCIHSLMAVPQAISNYVQL